MAKGIGDVIYSLLSNDAPVAAIVGTKIFPYVAVDNVAYPYMVYTDTAIDPLQDKDGVSCLDTTTLHIELYSKTLDEVEDMGNKVRTALDRISGTTETIDIQSISFTAENGGYADGDRVYVKIQSYSCRVKK